MKVRIKPYRGTNSFMQKLKHKQVHIGGRVFTDGDKTAFVENDMLKKMNYNVRDCKEYLDGVIEGLK